MPSLLLNERTHPRRIRATIGPRQMPAFPAKSRVHVPTVPQNQGTSVIARARGESEARSPIGARNVPREKAPPGDPPPESAPKRVREDARNISSGSDRA